jgi:hypothetical protein
MSLLNLCGLCWGLWYSTCRGLWLRDSTWCEGYLWQWKVKACGGGLLLKGLLVIERWGLKLLLLSWDGGPYILIILFKMKGRERLGRCWCSSYLDSRLKVLIYLKIRLLLKEWLTIGIWYLILVWKHSHLWSLILIWVIWARESASIIIIRPFYFLWLCRFNWYMTLPFAISLLLLIPKCLLIWYLEGTYSWNYDVWLIIIVLNLLFVLSSSKQ